MQKKVTKLATISQISYALTLLREGNFQRAAKACHVTQPTLSMQIQKLEEEYNLVLFDRSRKPVIATKIGAQVLEQFQNVLSEFEKIDQIIHTTQGELAGDYNLAIIPTLAPTLIPIFLAKFRTQFPKVNITLKEMPTDKIILDLKKGAIDAGLLSTPLEDPAINETEIFKEPLLIFHSDSLDMTNQLHSKHLPLEHLVLLQEEHCLRNQVLDLCAVSKKNSNQINFKFEAGSVATLINIIQSDRFFTILPLLSIKQLDKKSINNNVKEFPNTTPYREVGLATHRSHIKKNIHEALVDTIKKQLPMELKKSQNTLRLKLKPQ